MNNIQAITQAANATSQSTSANTKESNDIMGKEDFLTLLVTQLKNQDPLNPDDPTEFTAQLAQFSSLEQLFNLNESMDNMASSVTSSQKLSALSLIGKEVTYLGSKFNYDGDPVQVGYSLDGEAKNVTLHLKHDGSTVATIEGTDLTKGDHYVTWSGLTADGTSAPKGDYEIVVQATAVTDSIAAAPLVRSEVTGVDLEGADGGLLITKGGEVTLLKVKGVFEPTANQSSDDNTETSDDSTANKVATALVDEAKDSNLL